MSDHEAKVRHVVRARQERLHHCHWPLCDKQVPPAKWGCLPHWRRLPKRLRDAIWANYRIGQEQTLSPSREYVNAALEVQRWCWDWIMKNDPVFQ